MVLSFSYLVITVSSFRNRSIFKSQSTHILHIKIACKFLQIPIQSAFFCKFIDPQWNQTRFEVPFFSFMYRYRNNVSSVVEFWRWWVLKCKIFAQESKCSKDFLKKILQWIMVCQKVSKLYFQVNFLWKKLTEFFRKKSFKNINSGDHSSIFEPLYSIKSCPIIDELVLPAFSKYNGLLWVYWFLAKILLFRTHHLWNPTAELILMLITD